MSLYKCIWDTDDQVWSVLRSMNGILVSVFTSHTKLAARDYCENNGSNCIFSASDDQFWAGTISELFTEGQPGRSAAINVVDGYNNLICRAKADRNKKALKAIRLSCLDQDIETLATFFNKSVKEAYV